MIEFQDVNPDRHIGERVFSTMNGIVGRYILHSSMGEGRDGLAGPGEDRGVGI